MQITQLTDDRFDEFFELVKSMVSEAEFFDAIPDRQIFWQLHKNSNINYILAIQDSKIIGFIGGVLAPYFFSKKMRVSDVGFYVAPNHRGSRAAIKLIQALENWAKQNNISDVCLGQTTAINMEKTQKFYNRLGYKTVGFNTVKHLGK